MVRRVLVAVKVTDRQGKQRLDGMSCARVCTLLLYKKYRGLTFRSDDRREDEQRERVPTRTTTRAYIGHTRTTFSSSRRVPLFGRFPPVTPQRRDVNVPFYRLRTANRDQSRRWKHTVISRSASHGR